MSTQITEHFSVEEFEDPPLPSLPVLEILCRDVLEPTREFAGTSLLITSGYRDVADNVAVHGQPNSEHVYTEQWCATDFYEATRPIRELFDWMRNNPALPFHQLILEHSPNGSSVIHVSVNTSKPGVRSVLEGATHNAEPYVKVDYVPYQPPSNHDDVQEVSAEG